MLPYLPLLITFALGVGGVWLRTKKETDGIINRPTHGGWIVLTLLAASLVVGVTSERSRQRTAESAHEADSLREAIASNNYQNTIALLKSQLHQTELLGAGTDSSFREQFLVASHQLVFLRQLFLMQHELSSVQVSWKPSPRQLKPVIDSIRAYRSRLPQVANEGDWTYLEKAVQYGRIDVVQAGRSHWALQVMLGRPQGLYAKQFRDDGPEWAAFDSAVRGCLSDRFEIQLAPGIILADLVRQWPTRFSMLQGVFSFSIDRPGVRLGDLAHASVTFWAGDTDRARLPTMIRIDSGDPRVSFGQGYSTAWDRVPLYVFGDGEAYTNEYVNLKSGPFALAVRIDSTLSEVGFPSLDQRQARPARPD